MIDRTINRTAARHATAAPLYVAAVLNALAIGIFYVAVPYYALDLKAGPGATGAVGGLCLGSYAIMCLITAPFIDNIRPRRVMVAGSTVYALISLVLAQTQSVAVVMIVAAVYGGLMSTMWPPLMGWIANEFDGAELNRRLGRYNISWCGGLVIGPYVGGWLYKLGPQIAFTALCATHLAVIILTVIARAPQPEHRDAKAGGPIDANASYVAHPNADAFRWMARMALVASFVVVGLHRFQLPAIAKGLLAIPPETFGKIGTALSLSNVVAFAVLGYTHRWHYRLWFLLGAQLALAGATLLVYWSGNAWDLGLISIGSGAFVGVAYSSNVFYGVTGRRRRTRQMAIHEMLLSIGFVVGSFGGGYVGQWFGLRTPYPVATAILIAMVALEVMIYVSLTKTRAATPERQAAST